MPKTPVFPLVRHEIAGVSVRDLAAKFGTPSYVYDGAVIEERIEDLAEFDVVRYAQKACSNLSILDLVRRRGAVVDAVSAGEIERALAAGYKDGTQQAKDQPPEIVYTADIFDRESLELVVEKQIHVNCGSPDMIVQYGERSPAVKEITLRINPGFGHGHSQKTNTGGEQSKHGIWHEQVPLCLELAARQGLTIAGLHMHIGSGTDMEHLGQVAAAMEQTVRQVGPSVDSISAGGGLPVPYQEGESYGDLAEYYRLWNAVRARLAADFAHAVSLEIEPGRYITAESGYLLTEIRAIKQMGGNNFYVVDAGFNNLARPILYGAYHPMSVCPARGAATENTTLEEVVVGGPLCESGDIFTQQEGGFVAKRALPKAAVGDLLVIENAGAYGMVMSSNYNSKPFAAEILIEADGPRLIRQRQSFAEIVGSELDCLRRN